jgi:CSLREA domain-containing protein
VRARLALGAAAAFALLGAHTAAAKTFEVTRAGDTAPNGCNQGGCTLREAVIAANNRSGDDVIELRSGRTHVLEIAGSGEDLAATGDLDVLGPTTIRSSARGRATVDGSDLDDVFHAFADIRFQDIAVTDGVDGIVQTGPGGVRASNLRATGNSGLGVYEDQGGGIRLVRAIVSDNGSNGVGEFGTGSVEVPGLRVSGNGTYGVQESEGGNLVASGARAAGNGLNGLVEVDGGNLRAPRARVAGNQSAGVQETHSGRLILTRARVTGNESAGAYEFNEGGIAAARARLAGNADTGIQETGPGNANLARARVVNNDGAGAFEFDEGTLAATRARIGGNGSIGIEETGLGSVVLTRARVQSNDAEGVFEFNEGAIRASRATFARNGGSGLQEFDEGPLVLTRSTVVQNDDSGVQVFGDGGGRIVRSTITRNETSGFGGGLFTSSRVAVRDSTFSRNNGIEGGGIFAANDARVTVTNSTIANNESPGSGAGIYAADGSSVTLDSVTVARNRAGNDGGGLYLEGLDGEMLVDNSLIALNRVPDGGFVGADCFNEVDPYGSGGHNLLSTDEGCSGFDGSGDLVRGNPRIGPLKRNGGPTETVALKRNSPAIGKAGNDSPRKDQRGRTRDAQPDIGAYER